jgi:uncharacterized protein (DUF2141 family)
MLQPKFGAVLALGMLAILGGRSSADTSVTGEAAALTIRIENVSKAGGCVRVAIYDRTTYEGHDQNPVADATIDATAPETVLTLPKLRPGEYAVKMYQDIHRSGAFATSRLGLPEEPFGFSNDARPLVDQPSFDAAKFRLSRGANEITVHLHGLL